MWRGEVRCVKGCMDGWMDEGERGKVGTEAAGNEGCNGCMELKEE